MGLVLGVSGLPGSNRTLLMEAYFRMWLKILLFIFVVSRCAAALSPCGNLEGTIESSFFARFQKSQIERSQDMGSLRTSIVNLDQISVQWARPTFCDSAYDVVAIGIFNIRLSLSLATASAVIP